MEAKRPASSNCLDMVYMFNEYHQQVSLCIHTPFPPKSAFCCTFLLSDIPVCFYKSGMKEQVSPSHSAMFASLSHINQCLTYPKNDRAQ